jgi:two-component system phosphate regulon sensor histidine kinase PhoR
MVDGTVRSMLMLSSALSGSGFELLSWLAVGAVAALVAWLLLLRPSARRIDALQRRGRELLDSHTRAVDELKRERDLMGSILESMSEGVLLLDAQNQVVLVNPSLRSTLLLPKEVVGKSLLETLRRADLADLVARARSSGEPIAEEISVEGLKPRRLSVRVNPMSTPPGALLVVFFDVTEIRRLESLRRDFVANVSHELRTPVAAICSATETLLCGALQDPKAAGSFVGIIERNSQRMRRLVEDLLDLSRIESKEYKLDRRELALPNVVERCLSLLRDKARQGRIRTDVEIPEDLPDVFADARALEQVLVNLIENAIKYCRPGSRVVIRAATETDRSVRCTVQDSGPGIPEAELPRLFERFYRVDAGRSRDMGGTGLGLSIVKHLVEAMGGRVGVESRIGFGSSFWFTVPTVSDEAPVSVPPAEDPS